jgi:hypothetical protein
MNTPEASFLTWQQQFRTNKDSSPVSEGNEVTKWVYVPSMWSRQWD